MKERPILFSGPMVCAILKGRKTQTRRVVKGDVWGVIGGLPAKVEDGMPIRCPHGVPGDRLWARETWIPVAHGSYEPWSRDRKAPRSACEACIVHRTDSTIDGKGLDEYEGFWRPSIFMPRWASRITLEITDVRVQRLQEITNEDAHAEGCDFRSGNYPNHAGAFASLWDSINLARGFGWHKNPWVWALTFRRVTA